MSLRLNTGLYKTAWGLFFLKSSILRRFLIRLSQFHSYWFILMVRKGTENFRFVSLVFEIFMFKQKQQKKLLQVVWQKYFEKYLK